MTTKEDFPKITGDPIWYAVGREVTLLRIRIAELEMENVKLKLSDKAIDALFDAQLDKSDLDRLQELLEEYGRVCFRKGER